MVRDSVPLSCCLEPVCGSGSMSRHKGQRHRCDWILHIHRNDSTHECLARRKNRGASPCGKAPGSSAPVTWHDTGTLTASPHRCGDDLEVLPGKDTHHHLAAMLTSSFQISSSPINSPENQRKGLFSCGCHGVVCFCPKQTDAHEATPANPLGGWERQAARCAHGAVTHSVSTLFIGWVLW
ncbi:hypothetical protein GHT09_015292 [Marmota monax]|uniref:Uncharacterized protein n=1 Tax=Marmota monax TaxID=9995 RepID=A0A834PL40_MARMO|nr:hypothetical protein GHT09_015292 [Marmota monax]